jgi:hypothetical protein
MRRGLWFRLLTTLERVQVDLTVRLVMWVRSTKLAHVLDQIIAKLSAALQSPVVSATKAVGVPSARRLSAIAQRWGHASAKAWEHDLRFARFLAIVALNSPIARRGGG